MIAFLDVPDQIMPLDRLMQNLPVNLVLPSSRTIFCRQTHGPWRVIHCESTCKRGLSSLQKWEEHIRGEKESNAQSSSAAQMAWQRWAAVPRRARTVLKQADPEGVAILELSYLQFMEDVRPPRHQSIAHTKPFCIHNMLFEAP